MVTGHSKHSNVSGIVVEVVLVWVAVVLVEDEGEIDGVVVGD